MKIAAPISSIKEAEMLLHYGADELYCGVQTPEWQACFGDQLWMNRRSPSGANLNSLDELRQVVEAAHDAGVPVHVTMNAPFYSQDGVNYLLRLGEQLTHTFRVDGLIVSDINLITPLSNKKLPASLHLSSVAACINSYAVSFYQSLGIKRIILPRQLSLAEIEAIISNSDGSVAFEVFSVNDGCYFEEGFCQTTHALKGPFCLTEWEAEPLDSEISEDEVRQRNADLREYLWYQNNCGSSFQDDGLPNGPCSLCWFGFFQKWGVAAVKIVGREASFYRKMRSLQMVKRVMAEVETGMSPEAVARFARDLRNTPAHCSKRYMCYFR